MTLIQDTSKNTALVVEFIFLDGSLSAPTFNGDSRFTDITSPISGFDPGEPDATPDPKLKLKMQKLLPGMNEQHPVLTISDSHDLIKLMRREYSMPKVTCRVRQYLFDTSAGTTGVTAQLTYLAEGVAIQAISAPKGKKGIVDVYLETAKTETLQPSGIVITPQCAWTFGDAKTCGVNVSALVESGSLTSVTGNGFQVSISGLTVPDNNYWKAGFIYHDGVSMRIRDWDGSQLFTLSQRVSYSMATAVLPFDVEASPGCRLFLTDCRRYDAEDRFEALGSRLPTHNPLFEKGP